MPSYEIISLTDHLPIPAYVTVYCLGGGESEEHQRSRGGEDLHGIYNRHNCNRSGSRGDMWISSNTGVNDERRRVLYTTCLEDNSE